MEKWKRIEEEILPVTPYRKMKRVRCRLPNGHEDDFYLIVRGHIVCALVLTPDDEVVLAKQYRLGPDAIMSELPGGGANADEEPGDAIAREVLEETGYAGDVQFVVASSNDAWSDTVRSHFVITNARRVQEPSPETTEHIEVITMPLDEFRGYVRNGRLTDAETAYRGLDFLGKL